MSALELGDAGLDDDCAAFESAWRAGIAPFGALGVGLSMVMVLGLGGAKVIDGRLTLGDLVALNLYVALLSFPTMALGWMLSMWQRGIAAWQRLRWHHPYVVPGQR